MTNDELPDLQTKAFINPKLTVAIRKRPLLWIGGAVAVIGLLVMFSKEMEYRRDGEQWREWTLEICAAMPMERRIWDIGCAHYVPGIREEQARQIKAIGGALCHRWYGMSESQKQQQQRVGERCTGFQTGSAYPLWVSE